MPAGSAERTGYVLIHGSELGGWLWENLLPRLDGPAIAVDLPGRGNRSADRRTLRLEDAVEAVVSEVDALQAERVILVGHSFSGILLPEVVRRRPERIAAVVFLGATVPMAQRSWVDLLPLPQRLFLKLLYRLRPAGMLSPASETRKLLCNGLDEAQTARVVDQRVPEAPGYLLDPVPTAEIPSDVAVHYVRLTEDRTITDGARAEMSARLPAAQVHDLSSGHLPMLSHPEELAEVLARVAAESKSASPVQATRSE